MDFGFEPSTILCSFSMTLMSYRVLHGKNMIAVKNMAHSSSSVSGLCF